MVGVTILEFWLLDQLEEKTNLLTLQSVRFGTAPQGRAELVQQQLAYSLVHHITCSPWSPRTCNQPDVGLPKT